MYFSPLSVSPILIQFIPLESSVMYCFIGLGEPPLAISLKEPSLHNSQLSGMSKGISLSIQIDSPFSSIFS